MPNNLLKSGEFARLARTTKRTVLWYEQKEILKPKEIDELSNYRRYLPWQIIDFQVILLLTRLRFSLKEIRTYLAKNKSLKDLFRSKRPLVVKEIVSLQKALKNIDQYYKNLETNGTLVNPIVKQIKPFTLYYCNYIVIFSPNNRIRIWH